MRLFRRKPKKKVELEQDDDDDDYYYDDDEDQVPTAPTTPEHNPEAKTKDGIRVITARDGGEFRPSDVRGDDIFLQKNTESTEDDDSKENNAPKGKDVPSKGDKIKSIRSRISHARPKKVLGAPPEARDAAFSGPPRYDWMDIETAAAVKVQSVYRRNKVMQELEEQGISTAAMRNRARARNARQRRMAGEDTPSILRFCGIGFLFGDVTEEDLAVQEAFRKKQYEEKKMKMDAEEAEKRKFKFRRKAGEDVQEGIEVVDD
eukprot:CAMPEP_0118703790 /NCGR_PEP_ID=MMETSP0800-20121206/18801_1 /TAXON_ID=210618 ORGANISM="Striatella unipunctata, Strain CCMP2910" /NCGR_SAMPLE_ID=MMETSP0800 /ASSEMBLY_ACC=CAM_ASM_000638 /LENGTH=260 /DNA_ID=CAMNT_0006605459 /DNA_START=42 /DNA_END=824 /DNA_ORIENTATION=-